jgi:hypothetical protein
MVTLRKGTIIAFQRQLRLRGPFKCRSFVSNLGIKFKIVVARFVSLLTGLPNVFVFSSAFFTVPVCFPSVHSLPTCLFSF